MKNFPVEHIDYSVPGTKITVPVYIGKNVFDIIKTLIPFNKYSSVLVIADKNVAHHWDKRILEIIGKDASYMVIPEGEKNKTLPAAQKIWMTLSKKGFDRKSLVINIGGGMICDLGAFAASTFIRGIPFVQVPTTLLAQADAAIGGKTGINFNGLKNTIGTFSFPMAVISDTSFLSTLPQRDYRSGFAEIIKHATIADESLFNYLSNNNFNPLNEKELDKMLSASSEIKCKIVSRDPFEKGERKKLNFGHTVGHAIEMACGNSPKPLLHGEAIAIGMIAEARMSLLSGSLSERKFRNIEELIIKAGLPGKIDGKYKNAISNKMLSDKKNVRQQVRWVFLEDIGKVKPDVALPGEIVHQALKYILK